MSAPKVVVVEDDAGMRQALVRILGLGGFDPVAFASAEEMLTSGENAGAHCMVIDVQLPGMNGFALHQKLLGLGCMAPAIFISAFEDGDTRTYPAQAGCPFLPKPFSGHVLLETVRKCAVP